MGIAQWFKPNSAKARMWASARRYECCESGLSGSGFGGESGQSGDVSGGAFSVVAAEPFAEMKCQNTWLLVFRPPASAEAWSWFREIIFLHIFCFNLLDCVSQCYLLKSFSVHFRTWLCCLCCACVFSLHPGDKETLTFQIVRMLNSVFTLFRINFPIFNIYFEQWRNSVPRESERERESRRIEPPERALSDLS